MKATKFCAISTLDLTVTAKGKYMVEVLQKFVAFSEYMNFNYNEYIIFNLNLNFTKVKWSYDVHKFITSRQKKLHISLCFVFASKCEISWRLSLIWISQIIAKMGPP